MTIDIPAPRGFLIAPNGAKSSMRLVLVLAAITVLFILLIAGATFVWAAIYHPDALNQLMAGDGALALIGGYIVRGIARYKAQQSAHEQPAPPAPVTTAEPGPSLPPASSPPLTAADFPGGVMPTVPPPLADTLDEPVDGENLQLVALLTPPVPQECIDFILEEEGVDQPSEWPGDGSGISIGYGYDLGFEQHFQRDWAGVIPTAAIAHLSEAIGLKGAHAEAIAHEFCGIRITTGQASRVFMARTLPQEMAAMRRAMPGVDNAPPMIQGAILSLGYNRGWAMKDEPGEKTRLGMRQIRDAVMARQYEEIPGYLREMAPLWPASNGVHGRRLAEAKLAEAGLPALA